MNQCSTYFFRAKNPRLEIMGRYNTQVICELVKLLIDKKVCSSDEIETLLRRQQRSLIPVFEDSKKANAHSEIAVREIAKAIELLDETVEGMIFAYVGDNDKSIH